MAEKFNKDQYIKEFAFDEPVRYYPKIVQLERQSLYEEYQQILFIRQEQNDKNYLKDREEEIVNQIKLNNGKYILIHPVKVRNYYEFMYGVQCLQKDSDKNKEKDFKIIKMPYLDYLYYLIDRNENVFYQFQSIIELCLKPKEAKDITSFRDIKTGKVTLNMFGYEINKKDFDIIRKIILFQNLIDYDDRYINPEIEKMIKKMEEMQSRDMGNPSLEKLMTSLVVSSSIYKLEEIYELTIRKFNFLLRQSESRLSYQISKTGEASGMVTYKEPIPHWIYGKEKDRFDGKFSSLEELNKKIKSI